MEDKKVKKDIEIEKYFDGELSPKEVKSFEHKMTEDPVFGRNVETHGKIREALKEIERRALFFKKMGDFHKEVDGVGVQPEEDALEAAISSQPIKEGSSMRVSLRSRLLIESGIVAAGVALIVAFLFFPFEKDNKEIRQEIGTHSEKINVIDTTRRIALAKKDVLPKKVDVDIFSSSHTAVAVSVNGYFIVNSSNVTGGNQRLIGVNLEDKVSYPFEVIASDKILGISLIKIADTVFKGFPLNLPYVFSRKEVKMGEDVMLLGVPQNDITYHKGYVKSTGQRNMDSTRFHLAINDIDVSLGSVVMNRRGEVLGIVSQNEGEGRNLKIAGIHSSYLLSFLNTCMEKNDLKDLKIPYKNYLYGYNDIRMMEKVSPYVFSID